MDIKELEEYLKTEEGKTFMETQKQGLVDKNTELLGALADIKKDVDVMKQAETDRETAVTAAEEKATKAKLDSDNDVDAYKLFHEGEMTKKDEAINALKSNFAKAELSRVVSAAAAANSATPKPLELLIGSRTKSEYDADGKLQITVMDDSGNPLMHNGVKADMGNLVETLRAQDENAPFFSGTGSSGAGTNTTDKAAAVGAPAMGDKDYNLTEAMAAGKV